MRLEARIETPLSKLLAKVSDGTPLASRRPQLGQSIAHRQLEVAHAAAGLERQKRLRCGERHHLDARQPVQDPGVHDDQKLMVADFHELHVTLGQRQPIAAMGGFNETDDGPPEIRVQTFQRINDAARQRHGDDLTGPAVLRRTAAPAAAGRAADALVHLAVIGAAPGARYDRDPNSAAAGMPTPISRTPMNRVLPQREVASMHHEGIRPARTGIRAW